MNWTYGATIYFCFVILGNTTFKMDENKKYTVGNAPVGWIDTLCMGGWVGMDGQTDGRAGSGRTGGRVWVRMNGWL